MSGTKTHKTDLVEKLSQPAVSGFTSVPPPRPAEKIKSPRQPAASLEKKDSFQDTEGTNQTVLQQYGSSAGLQADCVKCQEPTGGAKFCPVCGELQGGPTGSLGGIMSPRAK